MKKIIILIICLVLLLSCDNEPAYKMRDYCLEHIKDLNCDEVLDCYESCNDISIITHANDCRDSFRGRLYKCYGGTDG